MKPELSAHHYVLSMFGKKLDITAVCRFVHFFSPLCCTVECTGDIHSASNIRLVSGWFLLPESPNPTVCFDSVCTGDDRDVWYFLIDYGYPCTIRQKKTLTIRKLLIKIECVSLETSWLSSAQRISNLKNRPHEFLHDPQDQDIRRKCISTKRKHWWQLTIGYELKDCSYFPSECTLLNQIKRIVCTKVEHWYSSGGQELDRLGQIFIRFSRLMHLTNSSVFCNRNESVRRKLSSDFRPVPVLKWLSAPSNEKTPMEDGLYPSDSAGILRLHNSRRNQKNFGTIFHTILTRCTSSAKFYQGNFTRF
ncbi:hypothetical protein CLF_101013 [Clonorchis sinensis]|uniref:Uncharacterized protein n=1 Tax=Clonorchis sinensis TaxID=79923 RepID=G7Y4S3_CLOSI|nr:hypothetical protein CLF_101013 [Clonorchis sinensis]